MHKNYTSTLLKSWNEAVALKILIGLTRDGNCNKTKNILLLEKLCPMINDAVKPHYTDTFAGLSGTGLSFE